MAFRSGKWSDDGEGSSLESLRAVPPLPLVPVPNPLDLFEIAARGIARAALEAAGGDSHEGEILCLRAHVILARGYASSQGGGLTARSIAAEDRPAYRVHR